MADRTSIPDRPPLPQLIQANSATRALNVLGDRWILMILYLAFQRVRRFDEFQGKIGLARSLLIGRLRRLQAVGILEKVRYRERPIREEYHLSEMGRDLYSLALMIIRWEKRWFYDAADPAHRLKHKCGHEFTPEYRCGHCGELVSPRDVYAEAGPGAGYDPSLPPRAQRRSSVPGGALNQGNPMLDRAFQVLGDRWTSHVIASAFMGRRRFNDFQNALGVAPNILSDRLSRLVELGVLRRELYQQRPDRWEYRLTDEGRDLYPLIAELIGWGDRWLDDGKGPPLITYHRTCGHRLAAKVTCDQCGEVVDAFNVTPSAPV
ncbi:MAG: helix-turn-helix domain-containing protein [Phenylobacterium sp.]|uniref:winged helix-turn-helix transcriptional regulator n=1 Tax=Phenylobacterium sp. TaxID=1871053 RepID=UPI00273566BB|nr:helix-turn-helix domain-containing protein [Phenylobacterium sp.]MDP3746857.1 helix-turn-helix domain-containing protein [Phenylobacterium sp.]